MPSLAARTRRFCPGESRGNIWSVYGRRWLLLGGGQKGVVGISTAAGTAAFAEQRRL